MRLHPFSPFVLTAGTIALAFMLPPPRGPLALYATVCLLGLAAGEWRSVRAGALLSLAIWVMLFLLHVVIPGGGGAAVAIAQGARIGAIATASVFLVRTFDPSRFLDAFAERGWPFAAAYLVVATLQAAPRLRTRAAAILEAQRTRGLRVGRHPVSRLTALTPLALPLVLGTLAEVDDRALALESRGLGAAAPGARRTALAPRPMRRIDRVLLWVTVLAVAGALALRIAT